MAFVAKELPRNTRFSSSIKKKMQMYTSFIQGTFPFHKIRCPYKARGKTKKQRNKETTNNRLRNLPKLVTSSMTILERNSVAFPHACSILKRTLEISSCNKQSNRYSRSRDKDIWALDAARWYFLMTNLLLDADNRLQSFANCHIVAL